MFGVSCLMCVLCEYDQISCAGEERAEFEVQIPLFLLNIAKGKCLGGTHTQE